MLATFAPSNVEKWWRICFALRRCPVEGPVPTLEGRFLETGLFKLFMSRVVGSSFTFVKCAFLSKAQAQLRPPCAHMADSEDGAMGPPQRGRGVKGQYVYWVAMPHPTPETVQRLGLHVPGDFSREEFEELRPRCLKTSRTIFRSSAGAVSLGRPVLHPAAPSHLTPFF